MYIYAYTPAHGLVCIIYTLYVLCSPEERFNSTNNESISNDRYRQTKFSADLGSGTGFINSKLPLTSDSGCIFVVYT